MKPAVWVLMGTLLGALVGLPVGYLITQTTVAALELQTQVADLQTQLGTLQNQSATLLTENLELQTENAALKAVNKELHENNSALQTQNIMLQNQADDFLQPRLVTLLGNRDCNWDASDMRLYIQGEVWNVGAVPAHNCSLHVTLYRGNVSIQDTQIAWATLKTVNT
ncbi:MAG: hypothetical protein ACBZ72_05950 [Candidatus Bathyarchaeia archaeon]